MRRRSFVADMTFVAQRSDGRPSPNPNVLIEYGWAMKGLTYQRIICIMNTAYGKPSHETLPFDLQHVRWPLTYELHEGATQEVRAEQRKALTNKLIGAIRACLTSLAPPEPKRVPLVEMREWATAAGWCSDVQSATIGDNDWWTFAVRLRQAAADGAIQFWGRRYVSDFGQALDTEVLVEIPKDHFAAFEFDPTALAQVDNYDLFTMKLGNSPSAWKGQVFRDLHVNADQTRAWLAGTGKPPPSAEMAVGIKTPGAKIGDYQPVCCLVVTNTSRREFGRCVVQMTELESGRRRTGCLCHWPCGQTRRFETTSAVHFQYLPDSRLLFRSPFVRLSARTNGSYSMRTAEATTSRPIRPKCSCGSSVAAHRELLRFSSIPTLDGTLCPRFEQ